MLHGIAIPLPIALLLTCSPALGLDRATTAAPPETLAYRDATTGKVVRLARHVQRVIPIEVHQAQ